MRRCARWFSGVLLLVACSAEQVGRPQSHGIKTPLDERSGPTGTVGADVALARLDLGELTAFLSAAEYDGVRAAYDDGRYADAVTAFEAALGDTLAQRSLSAESWFQLGHLRARAEQAAPSAVAFEQASKTRWLLQDYSRYFAALAYRQAGAPKSALPLLEGLDTGMPFSQRAALLRAELLLDRGERELGVQALRQLLAGPERPEGWSKAALSLGRALLEPRALESKGGKPDSEPRRGELVEALGWARRVSLEQAGSPLAVEALDLERLVLAAMTPEEFQRHEPLTAEQERVRLNALVEKRKWADATVAADELLQKTAKSAPFGELDCEARWLRARALSGEKQWGKAVDQLGDALPRCAGEDLGARLHFTAGKAAQADKRYSAAIRIFAELERKAPRHRLADDARLRRAQCYLELGDEARFTELLGSVAEDYPDGDVALDGVFELAVRRIEKGDWSQAANVLDRALPKAALEDRTRDHEFAGRERYFRARALIATGELERGFGEYEALIAERPLSYYMLHAYSRLAAADGARAARALQAAMAATERQPFSFPHRPEFDGDVFQRALALARHGELDWAERELASLEGLDRPELLWSVALVYGRAGAAARAHGVARGKLTDWLERWPVGDWTSAWELAFPRPYLPIVERVSAQEGVPTHLIYAVMREESAFRPDVVSHADAYGLMQLIKPTAKHFGTKLGLPYNEAALKRPSINIALGASVLKSYQGYFPDNPLLAIPGYNAGPGRPQRWLKEREGLDFDVWVELIPFTETRRYTKRVVASRSAYAFLYGEREPSALLLPRALGK